MWKLTVWVVWWLAAACCAQTPVVQTSATQVSPKAAYDEAMRPLELTRRSMANWSGTEIAALTVSMDHAKAECAARDPKMFEGADLVDLAKLCALGQQYPAVVEAATRYIASDGAKPLLAQAYSGLVDAELHLKDESAAFNSAETMLATVPYDALTAETVDEAIGFMQFVYTSDAVTLAVARQPHLLAALAASGAGTAGAAGAEPAQTVHELYADGIALAALQQLGKVAPEVIAATVEALDAALPASISPDDGIAIEVARRRYALLGKPLPDLAHPVSAEGSMKRMAMESLSVSGRVPKLPVRDAITALLLFPDWCAQCVRMATKLPMTNFTVAGHEAYLFGLLAETVTPVAPPPGPVALATITAANAAGYLRGTPTVVVDPAVVDEFAVSDFPFLIVTDAEGRVRVLQAVSDDAMNPGGVIDAAIARVGAAWPSPAEPPRFPFPGAKAGDAKTH